MSDKDTMKSMLNRAGIEFSESTNEDENGPTISLIIPIQYEGFISYLKFNHFGDLSKIGTIM